jgi:RHS repeat-associated protein
VYLHQGGRYDGETGLYDFRNRFYDPEKGRWLNLDPLGFAAGDSNLYRYEGGGPTNATDPSGLEERPSNVVWPVHYSRLKYYACAQCHGSPDGQFQNLILLGNRARLDDLPPLQRQMLELTASGPPVTFGELLRRLDEGTSTPGVQLGTPVGEPGLVEGLVPIWGNGRTAVNAFQTGHWGKGLLYTGLTVLDVFLVKSLVQGGLRVGARLLGKEGAEAAAASGAKVAPRGMATARSPVWSSATGDVVVDGANLPGSAGVQIARRLTTAEMEALTRVHGVEFSLVYRTGPGPNGGGGTYWLYSGTINSVRVPIGSNIRWISHTHPGGTPFASGFPGDQNVLQLLQQAGSPQRSSVIVPVGGTPFRFNVNQKRLP